MPKDVVAYSERGWPAFEQAISSMLTPSWQLLDLGLLKEVDLRLQYGTPIDGHHDLSGKVAFYQFMFAHCIFNDVSHDAHDAHLQPLHIQSFNRTCYHIF